MDTAGERAATTELTRSECQYQNYQTPKVCWSVGLNNVSQLAGFAKKEDLRYFARAIGNIEYVHARELTPTQEMPDAYKKRKGDWDLYQQDFLELMRARGIEGSAPSDVVDGRCLLCSEEKPQQCHRRLVAEYLQEAWLDVVIEHIP